MIKWNENINIQREVFFFKMTKLLKKKKQHRSQIGLFSEDYMQNLSPSYPSSAHTDLQWRLLKLEVMVPPPHLLLLQGNKL